MNYLAHIYLSGNNEKLMIGNFIADSIKGNQWKKYDIEIQKGIKLHRAIDHFTDTHSIVKKSKKRLWKRYRHYNAVIIDIFYDHFLAKNWLNYHKVELEAYTESIYQTLTYYHNTLPTRMQYVLTYMIKNNWLYNYKYIAGIEKVMQGMAKRASFNSGMENSTDELQKYYDEFNDEFGQFFPLLMEFSKNKSML